MGKTQTKKKTATKSKVEPKKEVKEAKKEEVVKVDNETRKYVIITVAVLLFSVIVGYFIGKYLFYFMYG